MIKSHRIQFWILSSLYLGTSFWFFLGKDISFNPRSAQLAMQVMDLAWIRDNFVQCLIYNHYQPPLFGNIFLGLLYKWVPNALVSVYYFVSFTMSFLAFAFFLRILQRMEIRAVWIWVAGLLMIFYSTRWDFESQIFYTAPSMALMTLMMYNFYRFFETGTSRFYLNAILLGVSLTLLNSFFNFVWAIVIFTAAFLMNPGKRRNIAILVLGCLLTLVIPYKNWNVFGFFGSTSSSGIVFIQRVAVPYVLREDLANEGVVSQTAHANSYAPSTFMDPKYPVPPRFKDIACLASPYKQFGNKKNHYATFNYNYYPTIGVTGQMTKDAAILYKRYPKYYWKETPVQWVEFFSGKGSWDDPVIPGLKANVMQTPLSARGILYMLGLAGAIFYFIRIRTRTLLTETKFLVFVLLNVGYALFAGIFVAIFDGPRYRLPFEFYFLFLAVWVLNRFSLRHKVIE